MKNLLCVTVVFAILAFSNAASTYSRSKRMGKGPLHTLDVYQGPAAACGKVMSVGLTDQEKWEIVQKHNELRAYVSAGLEKRGNPGPQPPAQNMQPMVWDDNLAFMAQKWANQCNFAHDPCRDDDPFYVGQNIAITMTTGQVTTMPRDIVQMWYDEVSKMDRNQVPRISNIQGVGHYTQVVWAKTNKLGCGKIVYQSLDNWKKYFVVCNYGPGGNVMGQPIYQIRR